MNYVLYCSHAGNVPAFAGVGIAWRYFTTDASGILISLKSTFYRRNYIDSVIKPHNPATFVKSLNVRKL